MAKLTRTKEMWHIPKRGSVHQTVYMIYVLTWEKFLGKSWSSGKQEALGSEMGKAGLTKSGKALTHQSIRTLLANLPKYLGFVYIDESSRPPKIMVSDIGYELIKKHNITEIPKHKNLSKYKEASDLVETSEIFEKQMSKLIITNPSIIKDCQHILVFPFRMTLKLLLDLEYLDKEEIGYILFHTRAEDEYPVVLEKIKTFRSLPPDRRTIEIETYKESEEGKLTLVKAPSAGYYMYLCFSTGLCKKNFVKVNKTKNTKISAIKLISKEKAGQILKKFEDAKIYDFKDDWFLWKEYFSNPNRLYPPHDLTINTNSDKEILITIYKDDLIIGSDSLSKEENASLTIQVFPNEPYKFIAYDLKKGDELYSEKISFSKTDRAFLMNIKEKEHKQRLTKEIIMKCIEEIFTSRFDGFDQQYYAKLKTIQKVMGKNYFDNRRKGGRLEFLFSELLTILKEEGVIDEVFWYGNLGKYGICEPAPGGKEGNPDVIFEIDDYVFVLELTTFKGIRGQWNSSEASSVPDHISKFKKLHPDKKVIGIFSAPSIHPQLEQNLKLNAKEEGVGMLFKPCIEFAEFLSKTERKIILQSLVIGAENQIED